VATFFYSLDLKQSLISISIAFLSRFIFNIIADSGTISGFLNID